jgi:hypothetical protein
MTTRQLTLLRKAELAVWMRNRFATPEAPLPQGGGNRMAERWRVRAALGLSLHSQCVNFWLARDGIESTHRDAIEERAISIGFRSIYDSVTPDSVRHHVLIYESVSGVSGRLQHAQVEQLAAAFAGTYQ